MASESKRAPIRTIKPVAGAASPPVSGAKPSAGSGPRKKKLILGQEEESTDKYYAEGGGVATVGFQGVGRAATPEDREPKKKLTFQNKTGTREAAPAVKPAKLTFQSRSASTGPQPPQPTPSAPAPRAKSGAVNVFNNSGFPAENAEPDPSTDPLLADDLGSIDDLGPADTGPAGQ